MELFREDGCMTDAGFRAMMDGRLDELGRLEAAEHLSYCDQCMDRYTVPFDRRCTRKNRQRACRAR